MCILIEDSLCFYLFLCVELTHLLKIHFVITFFFTYVQKGGNNYYIFIWRPTLQFCVLFVCFNVFFYISCLFVCWEFIVLIFQKKNQFLYKLYVKNLFNPKLFSKVCLKTTKLYIFL